MRVFLDTNLFLDEAIPRAQFEQEARDVIQWCFEHATSTLMSFHTFTNLYYILRSQRDNCWARGYLRRLVAWVELAPASRVQLREAVAFDDGDAEDQLQAICARDAAADVVVTRDKAFPDFGVRVLSPKEFLQEFKVSPSARP